MRVAQERALERVNGNVRAMARRQEKKRSLWIATQIGRAVDPREAIARAEEEQSAIGNDAAETLESGIRVAKDPRSESP